MIDIRKSDYIIPLNLSSLLNLTKLRKIDLNSHISTLSELTLLDQIEDVTLYLTNNSKGVPITDDDIDKIRGIKYLYIEEFTQITDTGFSK